MENNIQIFENSEFGGVRIIEEDGKVLFCGSDVAKALGYAAPRNAISAHCRYALKRCAWVQTGVMADGSPAMRETEMSFIPEGDVYRLIASSKLPSAEKFEKWVFDDVLPSIRKHGAYLSPATLEAALDDPDYLLQLTLRYKKEREKRKALERTVSVQTQQIAEMAPKASYYDEILRCRDVITITVIAKDYGMSACAMNRKLNELGIQYKQGGIWLLYQKYANQGYTKTETHHYVDGDGQEQASVHTKWTQKGRLFLYGELKTAGILPRMEQETA